MLSVIAPAKVNLHLAVGARRSDGYHDLTAVFHALELADEILIEPSADLSLTCDCDLGVPAERNLAYRAAVALGEALGREPRVEIRLTKRIPHGAGLGGGSSDAAAVILGLATLWGIDSRDDRCIRVAASIGADVPFFLMPAGAALMTGRGDELSRELPPFGGVPVALVRPPQPVPTEAAYAAFDANPVPGEQPGRVIGALEAHDAAALGAALTNNLESASSAVVPAVADALAWVSRAPGILGAAVAGSGSAVFALCESDVASNELAGGAESRGWWGKATRLGTHGVKVRPA